MSNHTHGKWIVKPSKPEFNSNDLSIWSEQSGYVASLSASFSNQIVNASLIAAAPELLEALKSLVNEYCSRKCLPTEHAHDCKVYSALIKKAEGGG